MSRRCCCAIDCLIWQYLPLTADIGEDIDPPWTVTGGGSWEVIGPAAGDWDADWSDAGYQAMLKVVGPLTLYNQNPHPRSLPTGRLEIDHECAPVTGLEYQTHFNATDTSGTHKYTVGYWPDHDAGDSRENIRVLSDDVEIINMKDDVFLVWDYAAGEGGPTTTIPSTIWRCVGDSGKMQIADLTSICGIHTCQTPNEGGKYVGFTIPSGATVYVASVTLYETEDTYYGDDNICLGCHCAFCGPHCFDIYDSLQVDIESSCPTLDGVSYTIAAHPLDLSAPQGGAPQWTGSYCAWWRSTAAQQYTTECEGPPWYDWVGTAWISMVSPEDRTKPITLSNWQIRGADREFSPTPAEDDFGTANDNSTCSPFYLEFGPYDLEYWVEEDPETLEITEGCECAPCSAEQCDWVLYKITKA